jgi:RNA polymerase sigma-70 factor (ECF subfamily)
MAQWHRTCSVGFDDCLVKTDANTSALLLARGTNGAIWNKSTTAVLCEVQIVITEDARNTEPSFRDSVLQYLDGLYGYAMTLTRNQAEAEDLVQETYVRALGAFERLRPGSNLKSWLFTILRNIRFNQIRDSRSKPLSVETDGPGSTPEIEDKSSKDPFSLYLTKIKQADVRKAIENLPSAYREVIVLREFEQLSYGEIAQILDCPPGTVMSRLSRARENLKDMLQHWSLGITETANEAGK